MPAIELHGVTKRYGDVTALRDLDLDGGRRVARVQGALLVVDALAVRGGVRQAQQALVGVLPEDQPGALGVVAHVRGFAERVLQPFVVAGVWDAPPWPTAPRRGARRGELAVRTGAPAVRSASDGPRDRVVESRDAPTAA